MAAKPSWSPQELEERLLRAFSVLRNKKYPHGKWGRALGHVPGMSKTILRERFVADDTKPRTVGRPSNIGPEAEKAVFDFAEAQAEVGKPVGKKTIVKKLMAVSKAFGHPSSEPGRARYFKSFMKRMTLKTVLGQKTDQARFFAVTEETVGRFGDLAEAALQGVKPENVWVADECGFAAESHDRLVRARGGGGPVARAPA